MAYAASELACCSLCGFPPEARALLWITLVDAEDGIIHAQRGVTLSPSFTRSLRGAIRAQALMAFDPDECTAAISKIFLNYPSTVDRLVLAEASNDRERVVIVEVD